MDGAGEGSCLSVGQPMLLAVCLATDSLCQSLFKTPAPPPSQTRYLPALQPRSLPPPPALVLTRHPTHERNMSNAKPPKPGRSRGAQWGAPAAPSLPQAAASMNRAPRRHTSSWPARSRGTLRPTIAGDKAGAAAGRCSLASEVATHPGRRRCSASFASPARSPPQRRGARFRGSTSSAALLTVVIGSRRSFVLIASASRRRDPSFPLLGTVQGRDKARARKR